MDPLNFDLEKQSNQIKSPVLKLDNNRSSNHAKRFSLGNNEYYRFLTKIIEQ
jgi:hypothetical protein